METTIDIRKELYRDYMNYFFDCDSEGRYKVSHLHPVGKFLVSLAEYSYRPIEPAGQTRLLFPACGSLATAASRFVFLSRESQSKFNDYLDAVFTVDFDRFYMAGLKQGIPQKDIIYAFISSRKLVSMADCETLKKRVYRESIRQMADRYKQLTNRVQYVERKIVGELKNAL